MNDASQDRIVTGRTYGQLTVVRLVKPQYWECVCICGRSKIVRATHLRHGHTKSCGCMRRRRVIRYSTIHGRCGDPAYSSWKNMLTRCQNPKSPNYKYYGGRGIQVCERWANVETFLSDLGTKPSPSHSLERIDNELDYCPENCRWATKKEQSYNKRSSHFLTLNGQSRCLSEWAELAGLKSKTVSNRIHRGMSPEEALARPLHHTGNRGPKRLKGGS